MNQNLLIVDDEWEILTWLEEMFRYDFDRTIEVYIANSAPDALELLNRVKFDVVLTDIHMSAMDGIALFYKIQENWPRCRVIFLTGYRDYDNVYELIHYKNIRYIHKSESDEVIQDTVRQVLDEIEQELAQEEYHRQRERKIEIAHDKIRKDWLDSVLSGDAPQYEISSPTGGSASLQELDIHLDFDKKMLLFLLRADVGGNHSQQEQLLLTEELAALLPENIPEKVVACAHIRGRRHIYLFVQPRGGDEDWECALNITLGAIEYTQDVFSRIHKNTFSVVYAPGAALRQDLPDTANRLHQALVSFVGKNHEMILKADFVDDRLSPIASADVFTKAVTLRTFLELRKRQEHFDLLTKLTEQLHGKNMWNPFALELYYSISLQLLQFINSNYLNERIGFHVGLYKLIKADEHENWTEAIKYLLDVSETIFTLLAENESTLHNRALSRIIAYIDENISEDLSLATLADVGGFNASYLSRLFKQLTGVTITDYITKKRIDLATNLLEKTSERIQDISIKSGYSSSHSFSRAFRNATGVSPVEYREMLRGQG